MKGVTMKKLFFIILLLALNTAQAEKISVVTTTSDLASITREIGGDKVEVVCLISGTQDPHFVEPRPSMVIKIKKAHLVLAVGMDLDLWVYTLLDAARNPVVNTGKIGFLDLSGPIDKLEVLPPGVKVDASMGDIHPLGNPHYWLDPENGRLIARQIARRLSQLSPENSDYFKSNLKTFEGRIDSLIITCRKKMETRGEVKAVSYHRSLPYFCRRFGLQIVTELEPKPGIPPSPAHLAEVVKIMKKENVRLILMEVFYNRRVADFVARQTGAKVVVFPNSVGGSPEAKDYFSLFETIVNLITAALTP